MSFPDVHVCIKLTSENEALKKKLLKVKQQRDSYCSELKELKEKQKLDNLLKTYATTREVYVQTEPCRLWQPVQVKKKEDTNHKLETENTNKLLAMHNQMMRRYEKEVKMNMTHVDTITELNLKISDLEKNLKLERDEVLRLNREVMNLEIKKAKSVAKDKVQQGKPGSQSCLGNKSLDEVKKVCDKMRRENDRLKKELQGLDLSFFEEVEDIKFSLQQSTKLNREYEKTLRKLCMHFSIPYPHPEKCLETKR